MIGFIKALLFVLATGIMGVTLFLEPTVAGNVSIFFTTVLGIYLGADIASMIAKTATLKKGDYEDLNVYKYSLSSVCLLVLIICSVIVKKINGVDISTALTSFLASAMIIIGCLIGGLEGNKIATGINGTDSSTEETK